MEEKVVNNHNNNCKIPEKQFKLREKEFKIRDSILTELREKSSFSAVYNILAAVIYINLFEIIISLLLGFPSEHYYFSHVAKCFQNLGYTLFLWGCMFGSTILLYFAMEFWAHTRIKIEPKSDHLTIYDSICLAVFVTYLFTFLYFGAICCHHQLGFATGTFFAIEQLRFLMKSYAFVRSNVPRVLAYKPHSEMELKLPGIKRIVYYLFAPTFVYRDEYPRSEKIRWSFILRCILEIIGMIFVFTFVVMKFGLPTFIDFGKSPYTWRTMIVLTFKSIIPMFIVFTSMFALLLHSWQNMFAELLRFGDRQFYTDWWNTDNYPDYFRSWNMVVHDFLFNYVFKDIYEILAPGNKIAATASVFILSAIAHEYFAFIVFGFFYPVLFITFLHTGIIFTVFKEKVWYKNNALFLFTLVLGSGLTSCPYTMEYFARVNCAPNRDDWLDLVVPRSWICDYVYT